MKTKYEFNKVLSKYPTAWSGHIDWAYNTMKKWKPSVIVELGVYYGHSLCSFAQGCKDGCKDAGLNTIIIGVDHFKGDDCAGRYGNEVEQIARQVISLYPNVELWKMSFNEALVDFAKTGLSIDVLHIDGRHHYEDIKEDFYNWLPFVKDGGHILLHDTQELSEGFGVNRFWKELKKEHKWWKFRERKNSYGLGIIKLDSLKK